MKIGVVSDIHLEFGGYDRHLGTGDVLLVAGDLHVASYIHSKNPEVLAQNIKGRSAAFFNQAFESYDHVICVMGNHEHYQGVFDYTQQVLRQHFQYYRNLHILEKESIVLGDKRFYGATMWTDFNRNDAATKRHLHRFMNDYNAITVLDDEATLAQRLLHPEDVYADHLGALMGLRDAVQQAAADNQELIVVGHHAPSKRSTHQRYLGDYMANGGYSSELEHLMGEHIPLWVHGHTHDSYDYAVRGTRIVCNPRGYVGHHLNRNFNPGLEIVL